MGPRTVKGLGTPLNGFKIMDSDGTQSSVDELIKEQKAGKFVIEKAPMGGDSLDVRFPAFYCYSLPNLLEFWHQMLDELKEQII